MSLFRMQERDLDLFLLEELHSNSGFGSWFAEQIDLKGYLFQEAEHSVSAKSNAKWGETDVLAIFSKGVETVAVLIEDKIAAEFADRQAERYQERAADLVRSGRAHRYVTTLIAPSIYLTRVPKEDQWHTKLSMEDLRDWFARSNTAHANWRKAALSECLARVGRTAKAGREDVLRFSEELAAFLQTQPGSFSHNPTDDRWGYFITYPDRPKNVQLTWKTGKSRLDLTFEGPHIGKAVNILLPVGINCDFADTKRKSDILGIDVPLIDLSAPLHDQADVLAAVMAALHALVVLIPKVLDPRA